MHKVQGNQSDWDLTRNILRQIGTFSTTLSNSRPTINFIIINDQPDKVICEEIVEAFKDALTTLLGYSGDTPELPAIIMGDKKFCVNKLEVGEYEQKEEILNVFVWYSWHDNTETTEE